MINVIQNFNEGIGFIDANRGLRLNFATVQF